MEEKRDEIRSLPVKLTQEEYLEKGAALARQQQVKTETEEQAKSAAAGFKDKISIAQTTINILARDISNGYEYKDVDCVWDYDYTSGIKTLWRLDTGEVVKKENISASERQNALM